MNTLDLSTLEVKEMRKEEQISVNGGCIGCRAIDWCAKKLKELLH